LLKNKSLFSKKNLKTNIKNNYVVITVTTKPLSKHIIKILCLLNIIQISANNQFLYPTLKASNHVTKNTQIKYLSHLTKRFDVHRLISL